MFDLSGKRALVTGATGGIGGAVATTLHGLGATVALAGRNAAALAERSDALGGARCHALIADLADPSAIEGLAGDAEAAMGGIDILVNNAGLARDGLVVRLKDDDWQVVLDVNLTAGFRLARASLRGMMRARWGRIISITSVVGLTGNAGQANYAAAKAGLTGMTKSLAAEVASRAITVNCVAPGFIDTAMTRELGDDQAAKISERVPAGRLGTPDDVAACVAFLASAEAGYVTGQTLSVNGGLAML